MQYSRSLGSLRSLGMTILLTWRTPHQSQTQFDRIVDCVLNAASIVSIEGNRVVESLNCLCIERLQTGLTSDSNDDRRGEFAFQKCAYSSRESPGSWVHT